VALSRRGGRTRFTLLFLVLTSITVITLDFRGGGEGLIGSLRDGAADALTPVRSAAATVLSPVRDAFAGLTSYGALEDENAELRARIEELEGQVGRDEGAERELAEALSLLDARFGADLPKVAARVVSSPISNFEQTIELDRGSDHGIAVDMPVLSGAGLVGRIASVSGTRSTVRLITDAESSVGVRLVRSGEVAVAEGEGPNRLMSLSFVDPSADVGVLELVVTSGLDNSVFPPGIPVGRVASVEVVPGRLEQGIEVRPAADLTRLRLVQVMLTEPR
jgi:rod shape-determining protein MreC